MRDEWGNDEYYNLDDAYGSSDQFDDGDLDGFQVEGEGSGELSAEQLIEQYNLGTTDIAMSIAESDYMGRETDSPDSHLVGMASPAALQLDYIKRMSPNMQTTSQMILSGMATGNSTTDALRIHEAQKVMGSITGMSPADFARQIDAQAPSPVVSIDPTDYQVAGTYYDETTGRPRRSKITRPGNIVDSPRFDYGNVTGSQPYSIPGGELSKTLSFLTNTTGEMVERGPGGRLHSAQPTADRESAYREKQALAYTMIDNIADKYFIKDRTRESDVYGVRKAAVVDQLTAFMLDSDLTGAGGRILPMPNELPIPGLKETQALRGSGTAAWTTMQSEAELAKYKLSSSKLDFKNPLHMQLARKMGDTRNTFVPIDWTGYKDLDPSGQKDFVAHAQRTQRHQWSQLKGDVEFIRNTLRDDMVTIADENRGYDTRVIGNDRVSGEQADRMNAINEAHILGVDGDSYAGETGWAIRGKGGGQGGGGYSSTGPLKSSVTGGQFVDDFGNIVQGPISAEDTGAISLGSQQTVFRSAEELAAYERANPNFTGGSERGGMYGDKGLNDMSLAIEAAAEGTGTPFGYSNFAIPGTDLDLYQKSVAGRNPAAQGSAEWLAEREGNVTGSRAPELWKNKGDRRLAAEMAERRMVNALPEGDAKKAALLKLDPSNEYTVQGLSLIHI